MSKWSVIVSPENRFFKLAKSLAKVKFRRQAGLFPAEGVQLIIELINAGLQPEFVLASTTFLESQNGQQLLWRLSKRSFVYQIEPALLNKLTETVTPQGIWAAFPIIPSDQAAIWAAGPGGKSWVLCLDKVQDPGNLGTIIRTCSAFGFSLVLSQGCVDLYNPKVVRASMGEIAKIAIMADVDLPEFLAQKPADIPIYATSPQGENSILEADTTRGCVLVIGNEAQGVSTTVSEITGRTFFIPMYGSVESLNAAVAAAIAIYELVRFDLSGMLSP